MKSQGMRKHDYQNFEHRLLAVSAPNKMKIRHLMNTRILKDLGRQEIGKIAHKAILHKVKKDAYFYVPEDPSVNIYFLQQGRVKLGSYAENGRENTMAILGPGEIFGELSLAGEGKRTEFAKALDDRVIAYAVNHEDLEKLIQTTPKLALNVTKLIARRLIKTERRLMATIFIDVKTRIINFLIELAKENSTKVGNDIMVKHQLTHQDIANMTASSRQTVTSLLNELKAENLIYYERNKFLMRSGIYTK